MIDMESLDMDGRSIFEDQDGEDGANENSSNQKNGPFQSLKRNTKNKKFGDKDYVTLGVM